MKRVYLISLSIFLIFAVACHKVSQPPLRPLFAQDVILAFGDSITFGTGARTENSYPQVLANLTGLKVINAGIPGEETAGGVARINAVLQEHNPQLVIVCLGGNDMLRHRDVEKIKENLKLIIQAIKNTGSQVLLIAVPKPGLRLYVPPLYQELGNELNVPVDETSLATLLNNNKYKSDHIHLNDLGYQLLAQDIAKYLTVVK